MSFFQVIQTTKICFTIFQNEKTFLQPIKKRGSKSRKIEFFLKGYAMVLVKKWPFFHVFFLGNIGQENVFYKFLEQKNAFLAYKNKTFKKSKKLRFFQRGLPMVLVKKWPFFHVFFLGIIGHEDLFYNILEQKKHFSSL